MEKDIPYIAIFASGTGSNAVKIISHFRENNIEANFCILSNKKDAPVLQKAAELNIETFSFGRKDFAENDTVLNYLKEKNIKLIVLAGFLWLVPKNLVENYPEKIINIHPALLPNYGGKGMYGMKVHTAVVDNKEKASGITIHFVDEHYDHGKHILQKSFDVLPDDTPEMVAKKVQQLEHKYFPQVVENLYLQ
ncbi:phosphoribosylglycinamide formyltransferase [Chondrinema litorale]|uniref:phosphoribosylglycinamide formyltransferase n=1 Tax=Chondrinema litorale TaxID=2994555 RepID=UPI002544C546|nr:phosphoribosylglycinamide formyltransferase [Chondrinema litorale]UZR92304.1 phosphoribosylglycinamide formyltransferase [Chondrinema litorale]